MLVKWSEILLKLNPYTQQNTETNWTQVKICPETLMVWFLVINSMKKIEKLKNHIFKLSSHLFFFSPFVVWNFIEITGLKFVLNVIDVNTLDGTISPVFSCFSMQYIYNAVHVQLKSTGSQCNVTRCVQLKLCCNMPQQMQTCSWNSVVLLQYAALMQFGWYWVYWPLK